MDTRFILSSSGHKAPTAKLFIIQYFIVTLYFLVLRSLSQSCCLKQLDSEDRINLVLPVVGNYRPEADRRMPEDLSLDFSQQLLSDTLSSCVSCSIVDWGSASLPEPFCGYSCCCYYCSFVFIFAICQTSPIYVCILEIKVTR